MKWVVDTCVLIDVLDNDSSFGKRSALALTAHMGDGLVVCPVTYIELAPAFDGSLSLQEEFFAGIGVDRQMGWIHEDTLAAHSAWARYVQARREKRDRRRPIADVMIGAFALRFSGLITRNVADFRSLWPGLKIIAP